MSKENTTDLSPAPIVAQGEADKRATVPSETLSKKDYKDLSNLANLLGSGHVWISGINKWGPWGPTMIEHSTVSQLKQLLDKLK